MPAVQPAQALAPHQSADSEPTVLPAQKLSSLPQGLRPKRLHLRLDLRHPAQAPAPQSLHLQH